jgi:hypothetical protein
MGLEGDEVFFLGDRGRSRRLPSAMRERLHKLPRASEIARRRAEAGWRGAVLDERACERVRKAAAHERQPERAERAMGMEGDEVFFLGDRGRSRRLPSAMRERLHKLPHTLSRG